MGRHYLDLAEARTVPTLGLVATHRAVADLLEAAAMEVVHGMAGLSKTYGVEQALARAGEGSVCWAAFPARPTMRLVAARLFEQLTYGLAGRRSASGSASRHRRIGCRDCRGTGRRRPSAPRSAERAATGSCECPNSCARLS